MIQFGFPKHQVYRSYAKVYCEFEAQPRPPAIHLNLPNCTQTKMATPCTSSTSQKLKNVFWFFSIIEPLKFAIFSWNCKSEAWPLLTDQPIKQPANRLIYWHAGRPTRWSIAWSVGRSVSQLVGWTVIWLVGWSIRHLVHWPVNCPVVLSYCAVDWLDDLLVGWSGLASWLVGQLVIWSNHQLASCLLAIEVNWSVGWSVS